MPGETLDLTLGGGGQTTPPKDEHGGIAWDAAVAHIAGDVVSLGAKNLFIAKIDNTGATPIINTETAEWMPHGLAPGEKGGVAWESSVAYHIGDMVHDEVTSTNWWCKIGHTSTVFATDIAFWTSFADPLMVGWMDATVAGGGLTPPVVNNAGWKKGQYCIVLVEGWYDLVTGTPQSVGIGIEYFRGDRLVYEIGSGNFVHLPDGGGISMMKGWFDPIIDGGGPGVPFPVINGSALYSNGNYVIADNDGKYNFVTGIANDANSVDVVIADRIVYDGAQWKVISNEKKILVEWFDPTVVNGGTVLPVIDGSLRHLDNQYVIAVKSGKYDVATGQPGTGIDFSKGDRLRFILATRTWEHYPLSADERGGIAWKVDTDYLVGDMVTEDGNSYICKTDHKALTGDVPDGSPIQPLQINWDKVAGDPERGGIAWKVGLEYKLGDVTTENNRLYLCTADHTGLTGDVADGSPTQPSQVNWVKLKEHGGIAWEANIDYKLGDVATEAGDSYICISDHRALPGDVPDGSPIQPAQVRWKKINGDPERGGILWGLDTEYKLGDTVTEGEDVYICKADHTALTGDVPDGSPTQPLQIQWKKVEAHPERGGIAHSDQFEYFIGDVVVEAGIAYFCSTAHTAKTFDVADWTRIGTPERGGILWEVATEYKIGDVIAYGEDLYTALTDNVGVTPTPVSPDWKLSVERIDGPTGENIISHRNWDPTGATTYPVGRLTKISEDGDYVNFEGTVWKPILLKNNSSIESGVDGGGSKVNLLSRTGTQPNTPPLTGVAGNYDNEVIVGDGGVVTALRSVNGSEPVVRHGAFGTTDDFRIIHEGNLSDYEKGGVLWKLDTQYLVGDMTTENADSFICLTDHKALTGDVPDGSPTKPLQANWKKIESFTNSLFSFHYRWKNAPDATPNKGHVSTDNADPTLVTKVYFHREGLSDTDYGLFIERIKAADFINIHEDDDLNNHQSFDSTGTPVLNGNIYELPVVYVAHSGALSNNEKVGVFWHSKIKAQPEHGGIAWFIANYTVGDVVTEAKEAYMCNTNHTSVAGDDPLGSPSQPSQTSWDRIKTDTPHGYIFYNAGDFTPDFKTDDFFEIAASAAITINNPINNKSGDTGTIAIKQKGTGSNVITFGSNYVFPAGPPFMSTAVDMVDIFDYHVFKDAIIMEFVHSIGIADAVIPPPKELTISWTNQANRVKVTVTGNIKYTNDGGATWSVISGLEQALEMGSGPYQLVEENIGDVTKFHFEEGSAGGITGAMSASGGSLVDMSFMFAGLGIDSLTLDLETKDTDDVSAMFVRCASLASLDISCLDGDKITDVSLLFAGMHSLTSIDMSPMKAANFKTANSMFLECRSLTQIDISGMNGTELTNIHGMFNGCYGLTSIDLSNLNISRVQGLASVFKDCRLLTSIDLSTLDTSSVLSLENTFENCAELTHLDLSALNLSKIVTMKEMLRGCEKLVCLSNLNTLLVADKQDLFGATPALVQPDTATQIELTSITGKDWVNGNACP